MAGYVVFKVDPQNLALPARDVEQVLRMVALAPLPGAPPGVEGVVDVHGALLSVVDVRSRLGGARREPAPEDHLLVVWSGSDRVALWVDRVSELVEVPDGALAAARAWSAGSTLVAGALRLEGGLVVVPDAAALVGALVAGRAS